MKHKWELFARGMYDSTYKCSICNAIHKYSIDEPESDLPPLQGCRTTDDKLDKPDNPEQISFEDQTFYCASHIAQRLHAHYGLTVSDAMQQDFALWIQECFNADQI